MPGSKRERRDDEQSLDLTPMIDVTFQLIIFFLVVTQITSQDRVDLLLPDGITVSEDSEHDSDAFTVHIAPVDHSDAQALPTSFGWFCYGEPEPKSADELRAILDREARLIDAPRDRRGVDPVTGISENAVIVRCDARCPSAEFGRLIELMAAARLYRIRIAILKDQRFH